MRITARRRRSGLTLLEILIAAAVAAFALIALMASLVESSRLDQRTQEDTLAMNAARKKIEEMKALSNFDESYVRYNADDGDDEAPAGWPDNPGNRFPVAGLVDLFGVANSDVPPTVTYDPDVHGACGLIEFPEATAPPPPGTFTARNLTEQAAAGSYCESLGLGMPRDLDGDGGTSASIGDKDMLILPVRITIEWQGVRGRTKNQLRTYLYPSR